MSLPPAHAPLSEADYEAIAAAVMETARGRWFLSEYARRNRNTDTGKVLEAIARLEQAIEHKAHTAEADRLRFDLSDMMSAITRTKAEIASLKPQNEETEGKIDVASHELDAIVTTTEKATSDILACAERIQEIAWTMRENGTEASVCDLIDSNTTEIYTACSFQDLTGQRIRKVIQVLNFLEARIDAMINIWRLDDLEFVTTDGPDPDRSLLNGPARPGKGLEQNAVDDILGPTAKRSDIGWQTPKDKKAPGNLSDFDLDDLEVLDVPEEMPSAPAMPAAAKLKSKKAAAETPAKQDGIEGLTPAAKTALFS
jgi:chemotaxis protein CheZ